jgi:branched-chain amino acid aminotransferase
MPFQATSKIWHNGKLIPWEQANIHVMSHVVHYGSSVFEGIRCYGQPQGSAIFRLPEHIQRLLDSARSTAWRCLSHRKSCAPPWWI